MFYNVGPKLAHGSKLCPRHKIKKKISPEIGNFVHHIDSGEHTLFKFLKYVISGPVLQIWGIKVQNWDKVRAFYGRYIR